MREQWRRFIFIILLFEVKSKPFFLNPSPPANSLGVGKFEILDRLNINFEICLINNIDWLPFMSEHVKTECLVERSPLIINPTKYKHETSKFARRMRPPPNPNLTNRVHCVPFSLIRIKLNYLMHTFSHLHFRAIHLPSPIYVNAWRVRIDNQLFSNHVISPI
jgi:hypothetical protein